MIFLMDHGDYLVDILDAKGHVVAQKPRPSVNKRLDRYRTVHVLMLTPAGELVLSQISERQDLPNIYARRLGTTVATIRRSGENAERAARRALEREIFLRAVPVRVLEKARLTLMTDSKHT